MLAGFGDGRADEGVGAGVPTLRGVELARAEGWTAPDVPRRDGVGERRSGATGADGRRRAVERRAPGHHARPTSRRPPSSKKQSTDDAKES